MPKIHIHSGIVYDRPVTIYEVGNRTYAAYDLADQVIWLAQTSIGQWRLYAIEKDTEWRPW